ncbi:MAG: hypothetical protein A3F90_19385 [Deltaproteobacteria bacterium RIFCSPLOWO2_12_FULL_60_19]|nr:MAG: hypothetical protein A3F90_19385 [Deltaproteobacteria bacterium RIFCSPLOWO2_12_FULL_60_19]
MAKRARDWIFQMQYVADTGQENRIHQLEMLQDLRGKARDEHGSFGSMTVSRWAGLLDDLKAEKLVSRDMDVSTLFDSTFLQDLEPPAN